MVEEPENGLEAFMCGDQDIFRLMWLLHVVASIQDGLLHVRKFTGIQYLLVVDAVHFHVACMFFALS